MTIECKAAIPTMQSAISIGGGKGQAVRAKLDLYLTPDQIAMLYQMQEKEIDVTMTVERKIDENGLYVPREHGIGR